MSVKGHCDDCESLVTITPTGKKRHEGFSAEYWRILEHKSKHTGTWCPGSGRLV